MSTVGDLTPNMIGTARIRVTTPETTVEGTLTGLGIMTDRRNVQTMAGTRLHREVWCVQVDVSVGSVTLNCLDRDTPCEVIA